MLCHHGAELVTRNSARQEHLVRLLANGRGCPSEPLVRLRHHSDICQWELQAREQVCQNALMQVPYVQEVWLMWLMSQSRYHSAGRAKTWNLDSVYLQGPDTLLLRNKATHAAVDLGGQEAF